MEKDGRLVNRAPAPQVPDRKTSVIHQQQNSHSSQIAQIVEPTPDQVEHIKKYQVSFVFCFFFVYWKMMSLKVVLEIMIRNYFD